MREKIDTASRNISNMSEKAEAVGDIVDQGKNKAKSFVENVTSDIKNNTDAFQKSFKAYVKENPFVTVGISLLAGIVIGEIIKR